MYVWMCVCVCATTCYWNRTKRVCMCMYECVCVYVYMFVCATTLVKAAEAGRRRYASVCVCYMTRKICWALMHASVDINMHTYIHTYIRMAGRIVRALLRAGVEINSPRRDDGATALHMAALTGNKTYTHIHIYPHIHTHFCVRVWRSTHRVETTVRRLCTWPHWQVTNIST